MLATKLSPELEKARRKLILALDVDNLDKALDLVKRLSPYVGLFKVGLELLTAEGAPKVVAAIKEAGGDPFYDGKFDDIPETVAKAVRAAVKLGVKIINVHASAGMPAMLAAVRNKGRSKIYAVTVLTSIDEENSNIIFGGPRKANVIRMAREAALAGCDGIICSAQELEVLNTCTELVNLKKMTPGIRLVDGNVHDQKAVMTPAGAVKSGVHYLVVGRPITQPEGGLTSEEAALKILEEIAGALQEESKARNEEIKKIFEETQSILTNDHFVYTSGKHGGEYVNKDAVYPHVRKLDRLCKFIADDFEDCEIDTVVGPVVGGVALAQRVASHLTLLQGKEIFAVCADKVEEKEKESETRFVIKRGQEKYINDNGQRKRVLVVEDILTTGGSAKKVVQEVNAMGGDVVGVGVLCNRGNVTAEQVGVVPVLKALINVNLNAYDEADCPLCEKKIPINVSIGKGREYLRKKQATE